VPVRAWALPPRRVPAEALRPRSVPVVPLRRISLFLSGFPRVPSRNGPKAVLSVSRGGPHRFDPLQLPVRKTDRSRSSCRHSFRGNLPPGGRRLSRDDQEKVGSARKPRASSPARPRFRFAPLLLAEEPRSASAAAGRFLSVAGRAASGHELKLSRLTDSAKRNRLWITRITGIKFVGGTMSSSSPTSSCRPPRTCSSRLDGRVAGALRRA
jgi:hypothetical protein